LQRRHCREVSGRRDPGDVDVIGTVDRDSRALIISAPAVKGRKDQRRRARLRWIDLDDNGVVGLLSGGQRQAVAVSRAAAFASRVVILDEPTAALGVRESRRVLDLILRLRDDGKAVIVVSHAMDHVMEVADRAVVLRRGRKVGELIRTAETYKEIVSLIVGGGE